MHVLEVHGKKRQGLLPIAGVIDFAREGGAPAKLFGGYCENQCSESWEFVLVAVHYEMVRTAR